MENEPRLKTIWTDVWNGTILVGEEEKNFTDCPSDKKWEEFLLFAVETIALYQSTKLSLEVDILRLLDMSPFLTFLHSRTLASPEFPTQSVVLKKKRMFQEL